MTPISGTIDEVGSLAKMMNEYGPVIVIISVFLMLFIVILFYLMRQQQQSQDSIMSQHQELIQRLLENQNKHNETHHTVSEPKDVVREHLRISNAMRIETSTYVALLKASRIAVYALHNGTESITGLPFLKFSCVSEYVVHAIDSRIRQHMNFPINFMSTLLEDFCNRVEVMYCDEKDLTRPANKKLVDLILSKSENKYIFRGIFDTCSNLIAFVVCEFEEKDIYPDNYKEKSILLDQLIAKLTPILEYSNFSDTYAKKVHNNETKGV